MALQARSLMNYGIQVTTLTQNIDFQIDSGGPQLHAVVPLGFYSTTSLALAVAAAMQAVDPDNNYSCTVTRNVLGGTQNRLTISTTGTYLDLLFSTGLNVNTSIAPIIGFLPMDYTGSTEYVGSTTTGTILMPSYIAYNYLSDLHQGKVFGAVNVSASGLKESVVFAIQKFIDLEFKYEPKESLVNWVSFFTWAIQQRPFDFIPEITDPSTVYQVTLEKTVYDSKGLGFQMKEMLPNFPNLYQTGALNFRIILANQAFAQPS
jgi:hypothetical protein